MAKIKIDDDVYLPSNPDGKVIDIDKKSGPSTPKPCQGSLLSRSANLI
jgi:hypothetical protein